MSQKYEIKKSELSYVTVSDWDKARDFFTNKLGMKIKSVDEGYKWMELAGSEEGGSILGVAGFSEHPDCESPAKPGSNAIVTFTVEDIAKTKSAFESKGVRFIGEIMEVPGHVKLALFQDFDGNRYQLVQNLGGA